MGVLNELTLSHLWWQCERRWCTVGKHDDEWLGGINIDGDNQDFEPYPYDNPNKIQSVCVSIIYDAQHAKLPDEFREADYYPPKNPGILSDPPYSHVIRDNGWTRKTVDKLNKKKDPI